MKSNREIANEDKPYLVSDGFNKWVGYANSPVKACKKFQEIVYGKNNPKLVKMYADGPMGEVYHVGYICGRSWMSVGTIDFLRTKE